MTEDSLTQRNRINQRNFRARRQNYVRDLEERLRKYENDGIQATIEIQTAARQVTDHNAKLRHLLTTRFGMKDHEIDAYLAGNGSLVSANLPLTPNSTGLASKPFLEPRNTSFQSIAPQLDVHAQHVSSNSMLSPALGLASLHKIPEQDQSYHSIDHPTKKQRRNNPSDTSFLTLAQSHSAYQNGQTSLSPLPDLEHDSLSESSNPQTPADQIDPMLRHAFTHLYKPGARPVHVNGHLQPQVSSSLSTPQTKHQLHHHQQQQPLVPANNVSYYNHNHNHTLTTHPLQPANLIDTPNHFNMQSYGQIIQTQQPLNTQSNAQAVTTNGSGKQMYRAGPHKETTSCEDAARIIASMRGPAGSNEDPCPTSAATADNINTNDQQRSIFLHLDYPGNSDKPHNIDNNTGSTTVPATMSTVAAAGGLEDHSTRRLSLFHLMDGS